MPAKAMISEALLLIAVGEYFSSSRANAVRTGSAPIASRTLAVKLVTTVFVRH